MIPVFKLLRKVRDDFIKEQKLCKTPPEDIKKLSKQIDRFIYFMKKKYSKELFLYEKTAQKYYIYGILHTVVFFILLNIAKFILKYF